MKLTSITDLAYADRKPLIQQPAYDLARKLERYYEDMPEDGSRTPGVHASELCTCKRQVVYSLYGTKKHVSVPLATRKRFQVGTALHEMLQKDFKSMARGSKGAMTFEQEVRVDNTDLGKLLNLSSSCDGVFTLYEGGEPTVRVGLEIKSISPDDYAKLSTPQAKHVEQATVYQACLDLPFMWFLYWNKGNQNYTPMMFPWLRPFDPVVWAKNEARAKECLRAAEDNELPEREEGYHCSWCGYAYECKPVAVRHPNQTIHRPLR